MRIRVLGGGWYGCHIAFALDALGHEVALHEVGKRLFCGASGGNPARLHLGFHYPRSHATRKMSQDNHEFFMKTYGFLTRNVPVNIYAVADKDSFVDYGNYVQSLRNEVQFIEIEKPTEFGLENVEGAVLTGERHMIIDDARLFFEEALFGIASFGVGKGNVDSAEWDLTIDCTFCSMDSENVDRYEPCLTALLSGPTDRAVTIMDGPFPSVYPWNENEGLSSLTSAKFTPFDQCETHADARKVLDELTQSEIYDRSFAMLQQLSRYYPEASSRYTIKDYRLTIRAMPKSGAAARLVDVVRVGKRALRVRAGKIDAVEHALQTILAMAEFK